MPNQDLLAAVKGALKESITTDTIGGSKLTPEKRDRFVRTVSKATKIMDNARRINMTSHTHDIDRVGFGGRILRSATEGQAPEETSAPEFHLNTLESKEVMAIASLTDSTLEDNIEKEGFENTLIDLIGDRVGIDLEELYLNGDSESSDTFLAKTDGWLKKAENQVDASSAEDITGLFNLMLQSIDKKYLRNREEWKLYVHWDMEDEYRDYLSERGTALGDTATTENGRLAYKGIGVHVSSNMEPGKAMLVPDSNLVYGVYRDVRIEPSRKAESRMTNFVTTTRVDCHFEDENAVVVADSYGATDETAA